jgi:hypothetical protein
MHLGRQQVKQVSDNHLRYQRKRRGRLKCVTLPTATESCGAVSTSCVLACRCMPLCAALVVALQVLQFVTRLRQEINEARERAGLERIYLLSKGEGSLLDTRRQEQARCAAATGVFASWLCCVASLQSGTCSVWLTAAAAQAGCAAAAAMPRLAVCSSRSFICNLPWHSS